MYSILSSLSPFVLADFYKRPDLFARVLFFLFLPLLCSDSFTAHISAKRDTQLTFRHGPCPCLFTPKNKHAKVRKMNEWDTDIGERLGGGGERQASTDFFFSFAFGQARVTDDHWTEREKKVKKILPPSTSCSFRPQWGDKPLSMGGG